MVTVEPTSEAVSPGIYDVPTCIDPEKWVSKRVEESVGG